VREVDVRIIEQNIRDMCIRSNCFLPDDLVECIKCSAQAENTEPAASVMNDIVENLECAKGLNIPICQDTGITVVYVEIGQDVHIINGDLNEFINKGVSRGYTEGHLRCSVVKDPFARENTGDNTPAIIYITIVSGDKIKLTVAPKGFGSENMSSVKMFNPTASKEDVAEFVLDTVYKAGSNACPPMVIGVGIGGNFEYCAYLAKKALCRPVSEKNIEKSYKDMESELLQRINCFDIGPQGFGGKTTALSVAIEAAPTHIAGLPVAVNVGCHVTRHVSVLI
jgi:fumarate hydratase subunit alpha